jgi:hypothetical protein
MRSLTSVEERIFGSGWLIIATSFICGITAIAFIGSLLKLGAQWMETIPVHPNLAAVRIKRSRENIAARESESSRSKPQRF